MLQCSLLHCSSIVIEVAGGTRPTVPEARTRWGQAATSRCAKVLQQTSTQCAVCRRNTSAEDTRRSRFAFSVPEAAAASERTTPAGRAAEGAGAACAVRSRGGCGTGGGMPTAAAAALRMTASRSRGPTLQSVQACARCCSNCCNSVCPAALVARVDSACLYFARSSSSRLSDRARAVVWASNARRAVAGPT